MLLICLDVHGDLFLLCEDERPGMHEGVTTEWIFALEVRRALTETKERKAGR